MSETTLIVTEAATAKILAAKEAEDHPDVALRVVAREDGARFRYELKLVGDDTRDESDTVVDLGEIALYLDPQSAANLAGATLDYVDDLSGSGLKFDNPNKTTLGKNPLAARVQEILDERINPGLASHGGNVALMGIEGDRVVLQFGGGCHGCSMVDATLKDGVAATLQQLLPEIAEVVDMTDHAAGENPYYA